MAGNLRTLAKYTVFIGSGKGGVGKSTVTINLAISLAKLGAVVGVLDADLYGPSIPIMMGLRRMPPRVIDRGGGNERVIPFFKFGIKVISIGLFVEEGRAVVWRGPMLHGALDKLISDVEWGELDFLLIDLPPGTGDVPISLSQLLNSDGALIVTTPQEVAMLDAIKAINSFHSLDIPLLGIVENMAGFTDPSTGVTHHIFGQGMGLVLAQKFETELLASIPLLPSIRCSGDVGCPAAVHTGGEACGYFHALALHIMHNQQNFKALFSSRKDTYARTEH